jgi:hypothetical protein
MNLTFKPIAQGCQNDSDIPIMMYIPGIEEVLVSIPVWNKLDLVSAAGALIKETLRFIASRRGDDTGIKNLTHESQERLFSEIVSQLMLSSDLTQREFDRLLGRSGVTFSDPTYEALKVHFSHFARKTQYKIRMAVALRDQDAISAPIREFVLQREKIDNRMETLFNQLDQKLNKERTKVLLKEIRSLQRQGNLVSDALVALMSIQMSLNVFDPATVAAVQKVSNISRGFDLSATLSSGDSKADQDFKKRLFERITPYIQNQ